MLNKRFSARERLLLLILILLFAATLYVVVVYNPTTNTINEARSEHTYLKSTHEFELIKAGELARMRSSLQQLEDSGVVFETIPLFDNISNVAPLLNTALTNASDFDLRFSPIVFEGNFAIREVFMVFSADNYAVAAAIVDELSNSPFSCSISKLSIRSKDAYDPAITAAQVEISLSITFYEVYHAPANTATIPTDEYGNEYSFDESSDFTA